MNLFVMRIIFFSVRNIFYKFRVFKTLFDFFFLFVDKIVFDRICTNAIFSIHELENIAEDCCSVSAVDFFND